MHSDYGKQRVNFAVKVRRVEGPDPIKQLVLLSPASSWAGRKSKQSNLGDINMSVCNRIR